MKKIVTVMLLGFLATSVFSQSDNILNWQSNSIKIDGSISDWGGRLPLIDVKTRLAFDIRNDDKNLYLVFQMPDQSTQFKIARAGMNINFAIKTKPKRNAAIVFNSFMTDHSGMHTRDASDEKKGQSIVKQKYLLAPAIVEGSGFANSNGTLSTNINSKNIIYAVGWDSLNAMSFELKIPLRELFGDNYDLKTIAQKDIAMTLKENAIENPANSGGASGHGGGGEGESESMEHGGNGGMGGGMGHSRGGMGHGDGNRSGNSEAGGHQYGSGGSQDRSSMFEVQTLKQKFKLNGNWK